MKYEERVTSSKVLYSGKILRLEKEQVVTPEGHPADREIVRHAAAVALLMITDDEQMILEKQWRNPVNKVTIEIPAGKLDDRDHGDLLHAAQREMNEETRLQAQHIRKVVTALSSPGFTDEAITLYEARDLTPVTNQLPQDLDENIHLEKVSLEQALQLVQNGQIDDMKTVMAIYYWASQKGRVKE